MNEALVNKLIEELEESKKRDRDIIKAIQENISSLNKLLKGNGNIGLCEIVRNIERNIKPLWTLISLIGCTLLTALIKIIFFG